MIKDNPMGLKTCYMSPDDRAAYTYKYNKENPLGLKTVNNKVNEIKNFYLRLEHRMPTVSPEDVKKLVSLCVEIKSLNLDVFLDEKNINFIQGQEKWPSDL